jgi:thioesterase domain-containing protein/acyl carrier protein/SAM-dependent methyltransferase
MARKALPQAQSQVQCNFVAINSKDPVRSLADATAMLWRNGQQHVQFWPFHRSQRWSYTPVTLPPYQFDKDRHWFDYIDLSRNRDKKTDGHSEKLSEVCPHCSKNINDIPYIAQDKSQTQPVDKFVFKIDTRSKRYQDLVKGHVVVGCTICPASMYLELSSHAVILLHDMQMITAIPEITIEDLEIKTALGLDTQRLVKLILTKKTEGAWNFEFSSTKNNGRPTSHATGIISLRENNSSIDNEQDEKKMWIRMSSLLEEDTDTEALRGTMVYKAFGKMVKFSSAYRGLRYLVGRGPEGAGEISMPVDDLNIVTKTPNDSIFDALIMDNFMQVPGAFMYAMRAIDEEEDDDDISYLCTGIGSVRPMNSIQGSGTYRAYTKIVREDNKEKVLDMYAFDKQSRKIIFSVKEIKFSRVPRSSLAKILAQANLGTDSKEQPAGLSESAAQPLAPKSSDQTIFNVPSKECRRYEVNLADVLSGVQEVLSMSLDVAVEMVTKQATLDELGADSLVNSEILANISDKFKIDISTKDFERVADVASLCDMISARVGGDITDTRGDNDEKQDPGFISDAEGNTISDWHKTVFEILSQSLDLPVAEIQIYSTLEDLGVDSLVATEIISNLNETFNLDISTTEFASMVDVASLCNLIPSALDADSIQTPMTSTSEYSQANPSALDVDSIQTPMTSSSESSQANPTSRIGNPVISDTKATLPTKSEGIIPTTCNTALIHAAFQEVRHNFDAHAKNTKHLGYWDQVHPEQLKTATAFIVEAFEKLDCPIRKFRPGEKLPALGPTLTKYCREILRLWDILEEAEVVERKGDEYIRGPAAIDYDINSKSAEELSTKLISDFPQYASMNSLPGLMGPHLADCLIGKADPISLLYGNDHGRSLVDDFNFNAPDLRAASQVLCDFFTAVIQSRISDGETLHILEVGAGTGGTTKHLLPLLQSTGFPFTYTFTDISGSLVRRAMKTTFKGIKEMKFLKLNIEENPSEELLGRHHIVVSTNCVHATRDIRCSLANIRKLLLPNDGCVVLLEGTQKHSWCDLVWGLLDGWWLFNDGRKYTLQSPWVWERAMQDAGFRHVDWSDGTSRESRGFRVICGILGKLEDPCRAKATSMLLHRSASDSGNRNLFLIPGGFGSGAVFRGLESSLACVKDVSAYALNSPFITNKPDTKQPPTLEELAATYVAEIKRKQPEGPYLIGGYSVGGVVAFEAVRQLLEDDNEVEKLFLIDTACPTFPTSLPNALVDFLDSIIDVGATNEDEIKEKRRGRNDHYMLANQQLLGYQVTKLPGRKTPPAVLVSAKEGVDKQNLVPRPKVSLEEQRIMDWFLDDRANNGPLGWDELLKDVTVIRADGDHLSMMKRSMVR